MAAEISPEPLIDEADLFSSWDLMLPLKGVDLVGLPGGRFRDSEHLGGRKFRGVREYEYGDDASDIDAELTAENHPDHWPIIRVNYPKNRPAFWIASDMLTEHQRGEDGVYDKRKLAVSSIYALLKTAYVNQNHLPTAVVASNDQVIEADDRARGGKQHVIEIAERMSQLMTPELPLQVIEERPLLSELLSFIGQKATRRVVAVVSDFRGPHFWPDDPNDNWQGELQTIAQRKNEIIAVEITSPEDSALPEYLQTINHSPNGRVWAGRQGRILRERYVENTARQQQAINEALANAEAIHIRLRTDDPSWFSSLDEQLRYPDYRVQV